MTKEEAIKVLDQVRQWTDYPKEAFTMAIDALSQLSLPANLDEKREGVMTLEEAIKHCEEKACGNTECANEHKQLVEWLKELQLLKFLPSNLDEAAEEYGQKEYSRAIHFWDEGMNKHKPEVMKEDFVNSFKAGAVWRDSQIPKLPEGLDEAAKQYVEQFDYDRKEDYLLIDFAIGDFKAGAEYMMGQVEEGLLIMAEKGLIPFKDGNAWCILLGENLQEGVSGFGDTITEAMMDFLKDVKVQGIVK